MSDPKRNLNIFEKMKEKGDIFSPREQFYYARELYYNAQYQEAIKLLEEFLNEKQGWIENNIEACLNMAKCYRQLDSKEEALSCLFRSFIYDIPRAEICCEIGKYFFQEQQYKKATFWYEQATQCEKNEESGGFVITDCYGYIPYIQLCVCYDKLGNQEKAKEYNEKAGRIKPTDKAYLYNKNYFNKTN